MVEEGPEQIQGEALVAMHLEVDRRRGVLAGWYHRHREGLVELTAEDLKTHERHFPEPWQVALLFVTDYAEPAGGCFRRTRAGLAGDVPLPFFEMVSNESLLARGVRRSHMDWVNVETVDSIVPDPPSRPEPPPEPEPEVVPEPEPEVVPEPEPEVVPEPEPEVVPEPEDDEAGFSMTPGLDTSLPGEVDVAEGGPIGGLEEEQALRADGALELDAGFELLETADDVADLEAEASAIDTEEILADLEAVESELSLPVLDESVDPDLEVEVKVDVDLPEPGWDSGDSASDLSLPLVEDVDLESFVTEVESADVAAQVEATIDMEKIEPGWDDIEIEEGPVVDVQPVVDGSADLDEVQEAETEEPSEAADEFELEVSPAGEAEPKPPRSNRTTMVVGGVLLALAIVVSALVFLLPSGGETESGASSEAVPVAGAEAAAGQAEVPADDPPAGAGAAQPGGSDAGEAGEALAAVDPAASAVSVDDVERLGDDLLEAISRYYGRAVAVDGGQATCSDLQGAYVEVEDNWIAYNVQGRARFRGRLPDELATRDERLYAGVQDVEREFTRSGCERP
jgi:hypothetical protein